MLRADGDDIALAVEQKDLAARLRVTQCRSPFKTKSYLKQGVLSLQRLYLERTPSPPKGDSGWYIGPVEAGATQPKAEELEAMYVYQLLASCPEILTALVLPPGYLVVMNGREMEAVLDANNSDVLAAARKCSERQQLPALTRRGHELINSEEFTEIAQR
jgi:hypothetical protein